VFILNKGITLSTSATAILATGTATARDFYINGTVLSASGYAFQFGTTAVADSKSEFVVSESGKISGKDYGLKIDSGSLELVNDGTVAARLTAITAAGKATHLVNTGLIESSAGIGIASSGSSAVITNHGTTHAALNAVQMSGASAVLTNNGELRSDKASAIFSSGKAAILTNHGTATASGTTIASSGANAKITNDGAVISTKGGAILATGTVAIITNSGTVTALKNAITLTGDDGKITNNGLIKASGYAIAVTADDTIITNNKTITAAGGIKVAGMGETVTNYGTITGTLASLATIDFSGASKATLHNGGLIKSAGTAFLGGNNADSLFNRGTITGTINLGNGNDYFDGTGGKVNGTIYGGKGNDVYVISDATIKLSEAAGGGTDLVKTNVSFTLGNNFENLTLNGSAAINGTGNALPNQLHGNSGKNIIDGKAGKDMIWGHGGADILTGGAGADQFVFATKDGKDTITDFTATGSNHDILDLTGLASITDYKDLVQNHMKQVGSNVYIDGLNGDSILLKNIKMAALHAGDFLF
jgi:Ca2+-binding RTX toxin-like protein